MPQSYPTSPKDKILRRFYEPLVLLSVLDPRREAIKPDLISDRGLTEQAKLWRDFLDQSSFLCDSTKGGDTVTAIAAQRTYEQPIFWLASNSNARIKAQEHYQWILSHLDQCCVKNIADANVENEIFRKCVSFSRKRIKTYATWLSDAIDKAQYEKKNQMTSEGMTIPNKHLKQAEFALDKQLFVMLKGLKDRVDDHHELCTFAYTCRSDESIRVLSKRHNAQDHRNVWSDIRHYIGRLGMWTKAVKVLIRGAQRFPHYIENAKVESIDPETKADTPNADYLDDFTGLIRRIPAGDKSTGGDLLTEALADIAKVSSIWETFHHAYTEINPRPHAELLVLEKFHRDNLEFLGEERYIGCSKPSCYCCHLYIQHHPGNFTPRPCHGNLWINWAPPIPLPSGSDGKAKGAKKLRLQDHHSFKMMQQMLVSIRQDLREQIMSRRPRRQKLPDSSTGMSSVAIAMQKISESMVTSLPTETSWTISNPMRTSSEPSSMEADWRSDTGRDDDGDDKKEAEAEAEAETEEVEEEEEEEEDILVFKGRRFQNPGITTTKRKKKQNQKGETRNSKHHKYAP